MSLISNSHFLEAKSQGKYASWRVLSILVVGFVVFSALAVSYFVYQNIFTTLSNANDIVFLQSTAAIDVVDKKAYDAATKLITEKQSLTAPSNTRNVFDYANNLKPTTPIKPSR